MPCVEITVGAMAVDCCSPRALHVSGGGTVFVNGKYLLSQEMRSGRPVWEKEDNPDYKIQWSTRSAVWMIDYVRGNAPYCVWNRFDWHAPPLDGVWSQYQRGLEPLPSVRRVGDLILQLQHKLLNATWRVKCFNLAGLEVAAVETPLDETVAQLKERLFEHCGWDRMSLNPVLVLPGGVSLESSLHDEQSLAELLP